jgi:lysine/arginine/ornithine transport system substrate-binding protein
MKPAFAVLLLAAAPAWAADLDEVKARGSLRVLAVIVNQENAFMSADPGVGFDREVLEGFCSLHRLRLELVPQSSWGALVPALQQGRGDVIAGRFNVTPTRREQIEFTAEVFPSRHVVLTRRPHKVVATVEELQGTKVGTVKGTSMAEVVAAAGVPAGNVDDEVPTGKLPDALRSGRVEAVVLGVENAMAEQRKDPELQLGAFVGPPSSLAYGVRKGDAALLAALNDYIQNLRRSPTWSRLVVKYFGESAVEVLKKARSGTE